jgi:hypothetical protein
MAEDLWPANIAESNMVTPVSILKEQAALLGEKTKQLVTGEVSTQVVGSLLIQHFSISAPTLAYQYELFTMQHGVSFYPAVIHHLNDSFQIKDEAELKAKLKEILAAQHTLNVVHSILAQVRS